MTIILPPSATGLTFRTIVRELAERTGELALSRPTSAGSTTTLIDTALNQYWPSDIPQSNVWVYAAEDTVPGNAGLERRARNWVASSSTLSFYGNGWPATVSATGVYEIHARSPRSRKIAAINEAVGQLFMYWYREVMDDSLVTVQNQWRYTLPSSVLWSSVDRIEIQANTNPGLNGYPYLNAQQYNVRPYSITDINGTETWYLQFGTQPPPNRTIRVYGEAYTGDMVSDTDTLSLNGKWQRAALAWIYDYGEYRLAQWEGNRQPAGQADRYRIMSLDRLNAAKERLLKQAPAHKSKPIIVPGRGDAEAYPAYMGSQWLGAFANTH